MINTEISLPPSVDITRIESVIDDVIGALGLTITSRGLLGKYPVANPPHLSPAFTILSIQIPDYK